MHKINIFNFLASAYSRYSATEERHSKFDELPITTSYISQGFMVVFRDSMYDNVVMNINIGFAILGL